MGWKYWLACSAIRAFNPRTSGVDHEDMAKLVLTMPPDDRIALARELLPEGFVVARVVDEIPDDSGHPRSIGYRIGWNACRAAMLGEGE